MSQPEEGSRVRLEFQGAQATNLIVSQQLALFANSFTRCEIMSDDGQAAATSMNADLMGEVMQGAKIFKLRTRIGVNDRQQDLQHCLKSHIVDCRVLSDTVPLKVAHLVSDL